MKLGLRKKKDEQEMGEQLPLEEEGKTKKIRRSKKVVRDEGSRWVTVAVLLITILAAVWFWLMGHGLRSLTTGIGQWVTGWGGSRTYVVE